MKENGVNISKRHYRNDADSRDIVCVIFNRDSVDNFQFKIKEVRRLPVRVSVLLQTKICRRSKFLPSF